MSERIPALVRRPARRRPRGMALIAVLWVLAAFGVLVASLGYTVRQQARLVSGERDAVVAQALADGAIQLALQQLQLSQQLPEQLLRSSIDFAGHSIAVTVQPLSGLIDLNAAPPPLLSQLLRVAGGLPPGAADELAQRLVEWRGGRPGGGEPWRFEAVEDLLLVPGVDYPLYQRLRLLVSADARGGDTVAPLAALPDVLAVLADGDAGRAAQIAAARDSGQPGIDLSTLDPRLAGGGSADRFRIQAEVPLDTGKMAYFVRTVLMRQGVAGIPWRTLHAERGIIAP
ncbi:type II secretion system protein GspK [Ottowia beijingensis]|uniref:type II secretion system protein GspK n=1 Tax=Ottowia beijingensis TaxID=1207057 RepID=UPI002FD98EA9